MCQSIVDNSFAPGIGHRLDGWPYRDLNVGAIINLSPDLSPFANASQVDEATVRTALLSWGPGTFDAALLRDGKAFLTTIITRLCLKQLQSPRARREEHFGGRGPGLPARGAGGEP